MSKYQVGDEVEYLPHVCHAFNCDANNEYPWVIGMKQSPRHVEDPSTGEKVLIEPVVELNEGRLNRHVLPGLAAAPDPSFARTQLVPLRIVKPWPAIVSGVSEDETTLDLDIRSNVGNGMITLHYYGVSIDETGATPHTCRGKGEY